MTKISIDMSIKEIHIFTDKNSSDRIIIFHKVKKRISNGNIYLQRESKYKCH